MARTTYLLNETSGTVLETESPHYFPEYKTISRAEYNRRDKEQALNALSGLLRPGSRVYYMVQDVSRSGMSRTIRLLIAPPSSPGSVMDISWLARRAGVGSAPRGSSPGIRMDGCGMDMGFAAVYSLGSALWPEGTPEPHGTRNGEPDRCGGYALKGERI